MTNNVIAGTIPNEITADWFNTKANEAAHDVG